MNSKKLLLNSFPLLLIGGVMAYGAAPIGGYLPNTTLDPNCAPGDTDCFVQIAVDKDPWFGVDDNNSATENTEDMYIMGKMGVGLNAIDGIDSRIELGGTDDTVFDILAPSSGAPYFQNNHDATLEVRNLSDNTDNFSQIVLTSHSTGALASTRIANVMRGPGSSDFAIVNEQNNIDENILFYGSNAGNVGIATSIPTNQLQIGDVGSHIGYAFATISDIYGALIQTKNSISSAAALWVRGSAESTTPTTLFRVQNNGRIAMGTDTPEWGMHMVKNNADARILVERTDGTAGGGFLGKAGGADVGTGTTLAYVDAYGEVNGNDSWMGRISLHSGNANTQQGEIVLSTSNNGYPTEKMRVTKDGRVGIGTPEPSKELEVAGKVLHDMTLANAARGICYSALPSGPTNKSIIMVPLPSNTADLDDVCHSTINPSWHAAGVAKGNYFNQNCPDIENDGYGGGYTSFAEESYFEANSVLFPSCNTTNAVVCCSTSFAN